MQEVSSMQIWVGFVATALTCGAGCANGGNDVAWSDQRVEQPAAAAAGALECSIAAGARPLPRDVRESSGLARSARDPSLFWTHNDAGHGPALFAIGGDGRLLGRVIIGGARAVDWEDIEAAPCDDASCLWIADIGDNDADRSHITVYRVRESAAHAVLGSTQAGAHAGSAQAGAQPGGAQADGAAAPAGGAAARAPVGWDTVFDEVPAEAFHARYPDGAQDAEALFAHRSGDLYIVTKGRHGDIVLFRWPAPASVRSGAAVTPAPASARPAVAVLERVRVLLPAPGSAADRVTAASATPDGRWVAVRTYRTLYLYRTEELIGAAASAGHAASDGAAASAGHAASDGAAASSGPRPLAFDLTPLGEPQGEGLAIADDGTVWLTSEAGGPGRLPSWSRLQCVLPDA
jgi:hypothetical protein